MSKTEQPVSSLLETSAHAGYSYQYKRADAGKPTLLFLHGFPGIGDEWHHQAVYCGRKSYGIVVPDLLGFGESRKPTEVREYHWNNMTDGIESVLQHCGTREVIGIGHDLGSWFLSRLVHIKPKLISAVAFLDVGCAPHGRKFDVKAINEFTKQANGEAMFEYWNFFCSEGVAALMDRRTESVLSLFHAADPKLMANNLGPPGAARRWVEKGRVASTIFQDRDAIPYQKKRSAFDDGGWTGPLNWYKALAANISWDIEEPLQQDLKLPTLIIGCGRDVMTPASLQDQMTRPYAKSLYRFEVVDAGHWLMLEKPDETNRVLEGFFEEAVRRADENIAL